MLQCSQSCSHAVMLQCFMQPYSNASCSHASMLQCANAPMQCSYACSNIYPMACSSACSNACSIHASMYALYMFYGLPSHGQCQCDIILMVISFTWPMRHHLYDQCDIISMVIEVGIRAGIEVYHGICHTVYHEAGIDVRTATRTSL